MAQTDLALALPSADRTVIIGSLSDALALVDARPFDTEVFDRTQIFGASALRARESVPPVALASARPPLSRPAPSRMLAGILGAGALAASIAVLAVSLAAPRLLLRQNKAWLAPATLAPSDPRVREVAAAVEQAIAEKSRLERERAETEARLRALDDELDEEATLRAELVTRRTEAARLQKTVAERDLPGAEELPSEQLGLKLRAARKRIRVLEAALLTQGSLSDRSAVERGTLTGTLVAVDAALDANAKLQKALEATPYRAALDGDAVLGFVPEDNAANVPLGAPLASCRWATLGCSRVGTVTEVFPVETSGTSPLDGRTAHGRFVRITLTRRDAARRSMLFVEGAR